jgi:T4 RnlA family RNA ligase
MKTIEFIKEKGLEALNTELGISVKKYDEGFIVLNYNQIESPKAHPVVMECRGLILDADYNIVSRSFDRFFNLGEQPDTQEHLNWSKAICHEKVDGSLIKIYNWKGVWYASTRGTAFAESGVNGFPITFKELVLKALNCNKDQFQSRCDMFLDPDTTYMCEVTAMENRVVTRYEGYNLWFLAARKNQTGEFVGKGLANGVGIKDIKSFKFDSVENCIETAKNLKDLNEGYVVYQDGIPVCKVKSPAYVALHHIRGEGTLNPKRIAQLVLMNEQDEYLKYFPEDLSHFVPHIAALNTMLIDLYDFWQECKGIEDQKEFALKIKATLYSAVLFQARAKKQDPLHVFHEQRESYKIKLLEGWMNV